MPDIRFYNDEGKEVPAEQAVEGRASTVSATGLSPTPAKPSLLKSVLGIAKKVWAVDAVKSVALTWLIRTGLGATGAGVLVAIVDAFAGGS
jgi:hypothetical protein